MSKAITPKYKKQIWNFYVGNKLLTTCFCCNTEIISIKNHHCGHVISKVHGGTVDIMNLRPICGFCNSSMRETNMDDYMDCRGYVKCRDWYGLVVVPEPAKIKKPRKPRTPKIKEPEPEDEPELIEVPEKIRKPRTPKDKEKVKPDNSIKLADRTCTICGVVYKYPNQLKRHNNTISCYVSPPIIREPVIEENPPKQYNCKLCEFTTIHRSSYSRHKKSCSKKTHNLVEEVPPELPITPSITKAMEDLKIQIANLEILYNNQNAQIIIN